MSGTDYGSKKIRKRPILTIIDSREGPLEILIRFIGDFTGVSVLYFL